MISRSPRRRRITTDRNATAPRLARLRRTLRARGLDALVLFASPRVRYLTGFTGSSGLLAVLPGDTRLVTDGRYDRQAREETRGVAITTASGGLLEAAARLALLRRARRVGFEPDHVSVSAWKDLRRAFPRCAFVPAPGILESMMAVKDAGEVAEIRRAVGISELVSRDLLGLIAPGMRESEIAGEIVRRHRMYGADGDAFEPIVASGPRSALPHARSSSRAIRNGDLLLMDFGCVCSGYASDLTRTLGVGRVPRDLRRVYDVVRDAQQAALEAARGGLDARALDAVARRPIAAAGYGRRFPHALGHGLGLHLHERPRIAPRSTERLTAGSVVTIEPGIYLPGRGGIRIEDDVLLTEQGCEVLSRIPREIFLV